MSQHQVTILWRRSNKHQEHYIWRFDNGIELNATPSASSALEPTVDPESAFVASISSCHMLSLMAIATKRGFTIKGYKDNAVGLLDKNDQNRIAITRVLLRPEIEFAGPALPDNEEIIRLNDMAHRNCFIANSVSSEIIIEPVVTTEPA